MQPLIIDAELSAPPSEMGAFYTFTLVFGGLNKKDILLECQKETKDFYWNWVKSNYIKDYIKELVEYQEVIDGFRVGIHPINIQSYKVDRITFNNLPTLISNLKGYI